MKIHFALQLSLRSEVIAYVELTVLIITSLPRGPGLVGRSPEGTGSGSVKSLLRSRAVKRPLFSSMLKIPVRI